MFLQRVVILSLFVGACEPAPAPDAPATPPPVVEQPPAATSSVLSADGWEGLRIGMTRAEVVAAMGEDANPGAVGGADPAQCDQFRPERAPDGMLVMVEQGRLTRISVSEPSTVETEGGLSAGDTASAVIAHFGSRAVSGLHKYSPAPAGYITVWTVAPPAPAARGMVYEIGTDGRVQHIHAGGPSIQYVEGCS